MAKSFVSKMIANYRAGFCKNDFALNDFANPVPVE